MDDVKIAALLPEQRCTVASVAGHAMYERANPFYEYFLGGHIDMSRCHYEQYDGRTVRVTGPTYAPASELQVKLEGAGKIGERYVGIVGIRDPYTTSIASLPGLGSRWPKASATRATSCISRYTGATPFSASASP